MAFRRGGTIPPADGPETDDGNRWAARPVAATAVNGAILAIPLGVSVATGLIAARLLPTPAGWSYLPWVLAVVGTSVAASLAADRVARRLLPLAALLRLSLVFPDRTPSRFAIALRAGTTRRLKERVDGAREHGIDPEPARAAATILTLVAALAAHEPRTRGHSERVRAFTDLIGEELGLSVADRDRLRWAALVHDIGKLEVPVEVLTKTGRLEDHEFEAIRRHPADGARIAAPLRAWLGPWAAAIEHHHERWDGAGYPLGLAGTDISLGGRIVAVADAFEVMTAGRTYQAAVDFSAARAEMARCAGGQFDPEVVRAFLRISLPRLRWAMGALSGLGQLPALLEHLPRVAVSARMAQTAGAVALSAGAAMGIVGVPTSLPPAIPAAGAELSDGGPAPDRASGLSGDDGSAVPFSSTDTKPTGVLEADDPSAGADSPATTTPAATTTTTARTTTTTSTTTTTPTTSTTTAPATTTTTTTIISPTTTTPVSIPVTTSLPTTTVPAEPDEGICILFICL